MKTVLVLLLATLGTVCAGDGPASQLVVRQITPQIVQGIKDLAVFNNPGSPREQVSDVAEGVEAWFELQSIPNNPPKRRAAAEFPYNFPKQLYLAQRGFLAMRSVGGEPARYW
ncbi:MAG: hypothetical protein WCQ57_16055 [Verrucomicrobiota bacterium]